MLTKEERLAYCNMCTHKKVSDRYGVLCGLTDNYPHFSDKCEHYVSAGSKKIISTAQATLEDFIGKSETDKDKKKKTTSWVGKGVLIYIAFKLILQIIKHFF